MYKVLDLGSGTVNRLTEDYKDFERITLDFNPNMKPDIFCDVRKMDEREDLKEAFDAVFCSHMIEHFSIRDIRKILQNVKFVMKKDAWFEILCPDVLAVMKYVVDERMDLDAVLYRVLTKDIRAIDVLYGLGNTREDTRFENEFMKHCFGFSRKTLVQTLHSAGFNIVDDYTQEGTFEIRMVAYL